MTTQAPTAAEVAGKLTKAQRAYLTDKAVWRSPAIGHPNRWMTFPPSNTHSVLMGYGLVDRVGQLRGPGLAVRAILMEQDRHD